MQTTLNSNGQQEPLKYEEYLDLSIDSLPLIKIKKRLVENGKKEMKLDELRDIIEKTRFTRKDCIEIIRLMKLAGLVTQENREKFKILG